MIELSKDDARRFLVSSLGLSAPERKKGAAGVRSTLERIGCIPVGQLDQRGSADDLVARARVEHLKTDDVYAHPLAGHAFEHFAKERCLLPARAFPHYRDRAVETPWWRTSERMKRISPAMIRDVLAEIEARGP